MSNVADAAAIAANATAAPQSNSEAVKDAFYDRCRDWGTKAGAGDTSKVGWIMDITQSAWDPNSPIGKGNKAERAAEAAKAYDSWRDARMKKAGEMGKRIAPDKKGTRTVRISEVGKYLAVGALPLIHDSDMGGYGTMKRALKVIREREDIKGEVEDLLSKVATAQKSSPDVPLADDMILEVLMPAAKAEQSDEEKEAALWASVRTQCESIMKKYPGSAGQSPDAKTARACADKLVRDLGGTAAQKARDLAAKLKAKQAADKRKNKAKGK